MDRRQFVGNTFLLSCALNLPISLFASDKHLYKIIPSTKEKIPVIGMGTWISFNVGSNRKLRKARLEVLKEFFKQGGGMIDSSPMYGSSEEVLGYCLEKLNHPKSLFSATKVWTSDKEEGLKQIEQSKNLWKVKKFDLMQIHNLLSWQKHLESLREKKKTGEIKYIGITTSHGRRHQDLIKIMESYELDFIQITYNLSHREVENKILPLAKERGIAVIANRPYDGGKLIKSLKINKVPSWAKDMNCNTWADLLLKFITSHKAITCAIPATTKVQHMKENMAAAKGSFLNEKQRQTIITKIKSV